MTTMQHAHWIAQAREHWKEHRPRMFKELQARGLLETRLREAAEATSEQMQSLMAQGFQHHEAWEATREQFLFLAEEPGVSEEAPVSAGLLLQREMNDSLRYLGMTDEQIAAEKAGE